MVDGKGAVANRRYAIDVASEARYGFSLSISILSEGKFIITTGL